MRSTNDALTLLGIALGMLACVATSYDDTGSPCARSSECRTSVTDGDPLACCEGTCVDTAYDEQNCGGCGIRCAAGERCVAFTCQASDPGDAGAALRGPAVEALESLDPVVASTPPEAARPLPAPPALPGRPGAVAR